MWFICEFFQIFANLNIFPVYLLKKKIPYKWTHAVHICVAQGSTLLAVKLETVRPYPKYFLLLAFFLGMGHTTVSLHVS